MRAKPTLPSAVASDWQVYDGSGVIDLSAIAISTSSGNDVTIFADVAAGLTQFRPYHLISDATTNRILVLDAEL